MLTKEQVAQGILHFCRPRSDEQREAEMTQVEEALTQCPEWKAFLDQLLIALVKRKPAVQTGTLIVTFFALGVEVGGILRADPFTGSPMHREEQQQKGEGNE
jgi:hypothetical protein